jgi:hypothetical protein
MDEDVRWLRPSAASALVQEKYGLPLLSTQIQAWCREGFLKAHGVPVMRIGNRYFINRDAFEKWIQDGIQAAGE